MALVYACITPHTPILVSTIGKEALGRLEKTRQALLQLEQDLYVAAPDVLLIITPHGEALPDAVSINLSPKYVSNFSEFGDATTKLEWKSEISLVDSIREDFKLKHLPLVLGSSEYLDYGSAVPLSYLTAHLPHVKVIPITTATGLDAETHYEFGKQLKDELMCAVKRVAVIASADLSHRVSETSPGGLSPKGVAFDEKVVETLKNNNPVGILDIDAAWTAEAQSCGTNVLALLAGILDDVHHEPKVLSYEKPLGVGYLVTTIKVG
jgi:aromatic ring-opening dioxygenase LigB subunit